MAGGRPVMASHPLFLGSFLFPPFSDNHREPLITVAPDFLDGRTGEKLIGELFVESLAVDS
jgi:hypothetical protein